LKNQLPALVVGRFIEAKAGIRQVPFWDRDAVIPGDSILALGSYFVRTRSS
jgi:hypothetical protein